jgi:predicted acyltransferase
MAEVQASNVEYYKTYETLTNLFVTGTILIFAGYCWDMVFPINKKIWSSSYVLFTTGLATTILALMMYLIEIRKYRGFPTGFFAVFGKNPLFIFVMSGLFARLQGLIRIYDHKNEQGELVYATPLGWFYEHICKPVFSNPNNGSLMYAISLIVFYWLIVYWMDRKKIYVRV